MTKPVLGYWRLRGLGTSIRLLFEYAGVDYEEKLYDHGPAPDYDNTKWLSEKFNLGLDFPNLPYLIDGNVKLTQSLVILRYLANKYNLAGSTEDEKLRADLVAAQTMDYWMEYARIVYDPNFEKLKGDYLKNLPDKLKLLSNFLGSNKFVAGDKVTYVDFFLWDYLERVIYLEKDAFNNLPLLAEYHKRVMSLDAVDKYFKSPKAIKYPLNAPFAYHAGLRDSAK